MKKAPSLLSDGLALTGFAAVVVTVLSDDKKKKAYERQLLWKKNHKEQWREYQRRYRQRHKEEIRKKRPEYFARYKAKHPKELRETGRKANCKRKLLVMQIVAGCSIPKCVRCGCDDFRLLEINHKGSNGCKEFRTMGGTNVFRQKIIRGERSIEDLEILCRACNAIHYLEHKFGKLPMKVIWGLAE